MSSSKILFFLCLSFISGIALQSKIKIPQLFLWGFLVLGFAVIFFFSLLKFDLFKSQFNYSDRFIVAGFCLFFLCLGVLRLQILEFNIENDELKKMNDRPEKITLVGYVASEPDAREKSQKLKVKVENSLILVTTGLYRQYEYLDELKVTGQLKTPAVFNDFNYKNYLLKDGVYSVMDFPRIELLDSQRHHNVFAFLYQKILGLKKKLVGSLNKNFSPPHSFILEGVVFGNDKNMPRDLKDKFNATGLSHVTAVSGSNIVILTSILMVFLLSLGFWRGQAFYFSMALIWLYILIIGFPSSGIRAAIMGGIALLAQKVGRQNAGARNLVLAAALMLLHNPLFLFYDIGFQLSFLASMGIISLKPIVDGFCHFYLFKFKFFESNKVSRFFLDIVSVTFAAQIFTLPIIAYNFGTVSLVSPVTNILVLPVVPAVTILGFLNSLLGIFSSFLGLLLFLPNWFLLEYFLKVLDIFYQPWATKTIGGMNWIWILIYYVLLAALLKYLNKFSKPRFLGY